MRVCSYYLGGRGFDLSGTFLLTDEEYEMLKNMDGQEIYYGEVAGKHSEVTANFNFQYLQILSEKKEECEFFQRLFEREGTGFDFKYYWLLEENAEELGADCFYNYEDPEEAAKDYGYIGNLKEAFLRGWNAQQGE